MTNSPLCDTCETMSGHQMSPVWALQDTAETDRSKVSQGYQNDKELEVRINAEGLGEWDDGA